VLKSLADNTIILVTLSIIFGYSLGSIKIRYIKLGSSAILFSGIIISCLKAVLTSTIVVIPDILIPISLAGFISTVGLAASKTIKQILKEFGFKFLVLSLVITLTGSLTTYIFISFYSNLQSSIIGTYVGSLTSSPGLAAAIEAASSIAVDQSTSIGLGYSIAYIPGVVIVILFVQIMSSGKTFNHQAIESEVDIHGLQILDFDITGYLLVVLSGIIIGSLKFNPTESTTFSLGVSGGVLLSSLTMGSFKKIGNISFEFNDNHLGIIRDLSLSCFLAIVGLKYGYSSLSTIRSAGLELMIMGLTTGIASIVVGYLFGKYILKIHPVYLIGGICGAMTSTPGLAAAIDSSKNDGVVAGYGAAYPFALIFMIVFTNILFMIT
jgi:putative transport protein